MELEDLPELRPPAIAMPRPHNPANIGYPATLPVEIALRTSPIKEICAAYGIDRESWEDICRDKTFLSELDKAKEMLAKDGMTFKIKAKMQSDELLNTSWHLIHHPMTPPNVKADLIKSTVRWAGHDTPAATSADAGSGFQININFSEPAQPRERLVNE